jgi:hypothetical protein
MGVKLVSTSGGSVEVVAPATASSFTATMPAGTGTVAVNGVSGVLVSGTAQASTSGTSIDFTSIPSWAKRVTILWNGVSTSGASSPLVQLGTSGGVVTTGYGGTGSLIAATVTSQNFTTGFGERSQDSAAVRSGSWAITNVSGNIWVCSGMLGRSDGANTSVTGGTVTLSGTLDRVRITTLNGTDTFDAGSINIMYE